MRLVEFEATEAQEPILLVAEEISTVVADGERWTRVRMRNGFLVEVEFPFKEVVWRLKVAIA